MVPEGYHDALLIFSWAIDFEESRKINGIILIELIQKIDKSCWFARRSSIKF
jgi:hypothetical protein